MRRNEINVSVPKIGGYYFNSNNHDMGNGYYKIIKYRVLGNVIGWCYSDEVLYRKYPKDSNYISVMWENNNDFSHQWCHISIETFIEDFGI